MQENQLLSQISNLLATKLNQQGITASIRCNIQPTTKDTNPTIYLTIILQKYNGYLQRTEVVKGDIIEHIERQLYESIIKISCQQIRDENTPSQTFTLTSLELANKVALLLQSDTVRLTLQEQNIGVMRVKEIQHTYYTNDEANKNQTIASFDFTISHEDVVSTTSPMTTNFELKHYRI